MGAVVRQQKFQSAFRHLAVAGLGLLLLTGWGSTGRAATLGLDMTGSGWTTTASNAFTLGFEFNLANSTNVAGLGFWDLNGSYGTTYVGLWTTTGTLIGAVDTATSAVHVEPTANSLGRWYFMNFGTALSPGNYVVGSWGTSGMEYAYHTNLSSISTNILTFNMGRYDDGACSFCFPNQPAPGTPGYFGANIEFSQATPLPAAFPLFVTGLGALGLMGWRKKRKAQAAG